MTQLVRRLPSGGFTADTHRYIKEWGDYCDKIATITGAKVYDYDPDVVVTNTQTAHSVSLPIWFCNLLIEHHNT